MKFTSTFHRRNVGPRLAFQKQNMDLKIVFQKAKRGPYTCILEHKRRAQICVSTKAKRSPQIRVQKENLASKAYRLSISVIPPSLEA